uniref:Uncharacterized protein n=1 Tax=Helianthus annuus TaxID=4232 RepID=A0A251S6T7_HELAN
MKGMVYKFSGPTSKRPFSMVNESVACPSFFSLYHTHTRPLLLHFFIYLFLSFHLLQTSHLIDRHN